MEEVIKISEEKRDDMGRFVEGNAGGPGRPKGSLSIMAKIKKYLEDNPNKLDELVQYYITNEKERSLLLQMIDGKPPQDLNLGQNQELPFTINVIRDDKRKDY